MLKVLWLCFFCGHNVVYSGVRLLCTVNDDKFSASGKPQAYFVKERSIESLMIFSVVHIKLRSDPNERSLNECASGVLQCMAQRSCY